MTGSSVGTDEVVIELLDTAPAHAADDVEVVPTGGPSGGVTGTAVVALLVTVGLGLAVLVPDDGELPPEPAPATTIPTTAPPPTTTAEVEAPPDPRNPDLPDGVVLVEESAVDWIRIEVDPGVPFDWVDDRFVSDDGTTERTVRLHNFGPEVSLRPSSLPDGYETIPADGAPVAIPIDGPFDHMLVASNGQWTRLDVDLDLPPEHEALIRVRDPRVVVLPERVVIAAEGLIGLSPGWVADTLGIALDGIIHVEVAAGSLHLFDVNEHVAIPIDELPVEPEMIPILEQLDAESDRPVRVFSVDRAVGSPTVERTSSPWIDQLVLVDGGELGIEPAAPDPTVLLTGPRWLTSRDGITWPESPRPSSNVDWFVAGPDGVIGFRGRHLTIEDRSIVSPLRGYRSAALVEGRIVLTGRVASTISMNQQAFALDLDEFVLSVDGPTFQLVDRVSRSVTSEGHFGDPNDGWRWGVDEVSIVDPVDGTTLVTFPEDALWAAQETALAETHPFFVATTTGADGGDDDVAWSLRPIDEVFGRHAVSMELIPGDGVAMAVVLDRFGNRAYFITGPLPTTP